MTGTTPARTATGTPLRARRVRFSYPDGEQRQYFAGGDLMSSHFFALLSATFPEGEDFFIRSVRNFRDQLTDPELQDAVKGFIAQEVTHRQQHRLLNDRLQVMGYPTARVDRHIEQLFRVWEKVFSTKMCLASTAAMEHYTATFAEVVLTSDEMQALLGDSDVRAMLLWHAFEECEHKAVAIDVYRAVGGTERMRILAMIVVSLVFWPEVILQTLRSAAADRAAYHPLRFVRSLNHLRRSPIFGRAAFRSYNAYYRRGFHPDDVDTTDLLARWSKELFDADGRQRTQAG